VKLRPLFMFYAENFQMMSRLSDVYVLKSSKIFRAILVFAISYPFLSSIELVFALL